MKPEIWPIPGPGSPATRNKIVVASFLRRQGASLGVDVLELVFVACLAGAPETCKDRSIWFIDMSLEDCNRIAAAQIDHWSDANPLWDVRREWDCTPVGQRSASLG